jgi:hypothetical protein
MSNIHAHEKGSALLIAAIIVLIAGLASVGIVYHLQSVTRETQEEQTIIRMKHVIHALSVYYQRYGRIPCPADPNATMEGSPIDPGPPFGAERGSGASGTAAGDCATTELEDGIVPFRTLGLTEEDAKDAWGNYLTLHVSQQSASTNAEAAAWFAANPGAGVSDLCRVKYVWKDPGKTNWYLQQALQCCVDSSSGNGSLTVVNAGGIDVTGVPTGGGGRMSDINSDAPAVSIHPPYTLPNPPALVLISHGRNGMGAYTGAGTNARTPTTGTSTYEAHNASGNLPIWDGKFYRLPRTDEAGSSYFDDIVMFETLSQLYAEVGNNVGGGCSFQPGCPPISISQAIANGFTDGVKGVVPGFKDLNGNPCPP